MLILNDVSYTSAFYQPIYITAYIGSVFKDKRTILHPGLKQELVNLERQMNDEEYEESRRIKLEPKNYIEVIEYAASFVYAPKDLSCKDQKFIRVSCNKYLCAEEEVLEQLYVMTKRPKFFVSVSGIIEEWGYNDRIVSGRGYGQFYLSDIRIGEEHKQLEELDLA